MKNRILLSLIILLGNVSQVVSQLRTSSTTSTPITCCDLHYSDCHDATGSLILPICDYTDGYNPTDITFTPTPFSLPGEFSTRLPSPSPTPACCDLRYSTCHDSTGSLILPLCKYTQYYDNNNVTLTPSPTLSSSPKMPQVEIPSSSSSQTPTATPTQPAMRSPMESSSPKIPPAESPSAMRSQTPTATPTQSAMRSPMESSSPKMPPAESPSAMRSPMESSSPKIPPAESQSVMRSQTLTATPTQPAIRTYRESSSPTPVKVSDNTVNNNNQSSDIATISTTPRPSRYPVVSALIPIRPIQVSVPTIPRIQNITRLPNVIETSIKITGGNSEEFNNPERIQEAIMCLGCSLHLPLENIQIKNITMTQNSNRIPITFDRRFGSLNSSGMVFCPIMNQSLPVSTTIHFRGRRIQQQTGTIEIEYYIQPNDNLMSMTTEEFNNIIQNTPEFLAFSSSLGGNSLVAVAPIELTSTTIYSNTDSSPSQNAGNVSNPPLSVGGIVSLSIIGSICVGIALIVTAVVYRQNKRRSLRQNTIVRQLRTHSDISEIESVIMNSPTQKVRFGPITMRSHV